MRILIISEASSYMRGGVPAETRSLVQGLAARGHAVALACDHPLQGAEAALHLPLSSPTQVRFVEEASAALSRFRPEFVHVMCMSSRGILRLRTILEGRPWAMTMHSVPPFENKLHGWHRHDNLHYRLRDIRYLPNSVLWRYVFRQGRIPRIVAHSEFVERAVVRYGYPPDRIGRIALFFRPDPQAREEETGVGDTQAPLIVTVGGLTHTKGQIDVIKAMPFLLDRFPRLKYHMVGEVRDASYVAYLRSLAAKLGVDGHIRISSDLDKAALDRELSCADVYVQPSHEEGFCLAYAEAATRVPRLVGTMAGAIADMSEQDPGASIVPVRQPHALGIAIAAQLAGRLPGDHMARRVARLANRFSYADYLTAHERLYGAELSSTAAPKEKGPKRAPSSDEI